jgi:tRNA(fMet)-specific endonuclease VapC
MTPAGMSGSSLYLLDTNTVAYILDGRSRMARATMSEVLQHSVVAISAITEGELLYGLARKPEATRLRAGVEALLSSVQILPWDSSAAKAYGTLRARMAAAGRNLSNMDMLLAAHAIAVDAILVTRDRALLQVEALRPVANWAGDI